MVLTQIYAATVVSYQERAISIFFQHFQDGQGGAILSHSLASSQPMKLNVLFLVEIVQLVVIIRLDLVPEVLDLLFGRSNCSATFSDHPGAFALPGQFGLFGVNYLDT